jgi:FixJ family two-component response regulator
MSEERAAVFVVDDDPSMRRSLDTLLRSEALGQAAGPRATSLA